MKVHWTDEALSHLDNIYRYIAADAPVYALRMVDKITRRSQQIGAFPQSGREVPEYQEQDIREVLEAPYRIVYRIKSDQHNGTSSAVTILIYSISYNI